MSSLTIIERGYLERLFHMDSGYVLTFSDTTFGHFMADAVGIDIHNHKYQSQGSSKAKKLRAFWTLEPDHLAGKAVTALIEYIEAHPLSDEISSEQNKLIETCKSIGHRLLAGKVNFDPLKRTAAAIDARYLTEQTRRMEQCVHSDPALAIGTAKCPPTLLDYSKFPRSSRISCHSIETYIHYAWRERTFLQVPPLWAVAQIQSISVYCLRFICFTHVIDGEPVHCSDVLSSIPAFVFRYVY